ncbi:MAG: hypothetical protein AB1540_09650 [Bdellovibrionota bacterium]
MKNLWLRSSATAVVALWSAAAIAQSSTSAVKGSTSKASAPSNTITSDASVVSSSKKELPLSLSTLSYVYGPRVNDPGNEQVPDEAVDATTGINTRHQISLGYKVDKQTKITPVLDFDYQLTDPDPKKTHRREFRMRDSFVKVSRSGLIESNIQGNALALDGDVRAFVPSSKSSRDNNNIGGLRLSLNPSLQFGKSPFSISVANWARYWIQTKKTNAKGEGLPSYAFYTGPQVNYAFSDNVTAFVLYETSTTINTKDESDSLEVNAPGFSNADLEPGVDIRLHRRVTLTPYLNWYTNQRLETTTMNLAAAFTLL